MKKIGITFTVCLALSAVFTSASAIAIPIGHSANRVHKFDSDKSTYSVRYKNVTVKDALKAENKFTAKAVSKNGKSKVNTFPTNV